jgi:hypothetical protein
MGSELRCAEGLGAKATTRNTSPGGEDCSVVNLESTITIPIFLVPTIIL